VSGVTKGKMEGEPDKGISLYLWGGKKLTGERQNELTLHSKSGKNRELWRGGGGCFLEEHKGAGGVKGNTGWGVGDEGGMRPPFIPAMQGRGKEGG